MNINYIILAHKNPDQLSRMVKTLDEKWVRFYIHIDKNINIKPFQNRLKHFPNVYFLNDGERQPGIWGDIGIVRGTLNAIKRILTESTDGYTVLLTGQDYPLKNNFFIRDYFKKNPSTAYITMYPMPNNILENGGMHRLNKYKINKANKRGYFLLLPSIYEREFYKKETLGKLNYLRKTKKWKAFKNIFFKRTHPKNINPYAGGVYWALPTEILRKIICFTAANPKFLQYHTYTLCADEIFFHTIIGFLKNKEQLTTKRSLTYVNWERPIGPLPVTFIKDDIKELTLASKHHLFARKFDMQIDTGILKLIDSELLK